LLSVCGSGVKGEANLIYLHSQQKNRSSTGIHLNISGDWGPKVGLHTKFTLFKVIRLCHPSYVKLPLRDLVDEPTTKKQAQL
jgi:hypothetical protein